MVQASQLTESNRQPNCLWNVILTVSQSGTFVGSIHNRKKRRYDVQNRQSHCYKLIKYLLKIHDSQERKRDEFRKSDLWFDEDLERKLKHERYRERELSFEDARERVLECRLGPEAYQEHKLRKRHKDRLLERLTGEKSSNEDERKRRSHFKAAASKATKRKAKKPIIYKRSPLSEMSFPPNT